MQSFAAEMTYTNANGIWDELISAYVQSSENSIQANIWICDSGASHHMSANKQYFATDPQFSVSIEISLSYNNKIYAYCFGKVNIEVCICGKGYDTYMKYVWYVLNDMVNGTNWLKR